MPDYLSMLEICGFSCIINLRVYRTPQLNRREANMQAISDHINPEAQAEAEEELQKLPLYIEALSGAETPSFPLLASTHQRTIEQAQRRYDVMLRRQQMLQAGYPELKKTPGGQAGFLWNGPVFKRPNFWRLLTFATFGALCLVSFAPVFLDLLSVRIIPTTVGLSLMVLVVLAAMSWGLTTEGKHLILEKYGLSYPLKSSRLLSFSNIPTEAHERIEQARNLFDGVGFLVLPKSCDDPFLQSSQIIVGWVKGHGRFFVVTAWEKSKSASSSLTPITHMV